MGQQQFLLIVLGLIVVGLSIFVGISVAATSAEQACRDALMSDLITLSSQARAHYHRPAALRGGGSSFANFKIPEIQKTSEHGIIEHIYEGHNTNHIHFQATGTVPGKNGIDPVRIEIILTADETRIREHN
jgi:hypothetical protein